MLKIALELVVRLKGRLLASLHAATRRRARLVAVGALWMVAAGNKVVVLELVDLIFGDAVRRPRSA